VILLLMLQCIAGMIISQLVRPFILDQNNDLMERQMVFSYYGTFSRSQITMFEVHLANFAPACRVLVDYCGEWYAAVFLAYRCLAGYAVLNVINAVFIQQTMAMAQRDRDVLIKQTERSIKSNSKNLQSIFSKLDTSKDGSLAYLEFQEAIRSNPQIRLWMEALEIDTTDLEGLFNTLDTDGDSKLTAEEFFGAAMRIRGPAKSADMLCVLNQLKKIENRMDDLGGRSERH